MMEGEFCRLPVESQGVCSSFTSYVFAKPDNVTSQIEWLVFLRAICETVSILLMEESRGSLFSLCNMEKKKGVLLLIVTL